tara:strand:- start:47 stop:241 length:195 start_codon:yes stop_codon:yes gene_type:complete
MKVRSKNKKEKQYDQLQLDQARRDLAETAANFLQMTRVGESWDFENKICSVYRYKFADVATSGR